MDKNFTLKPQVILCLLSISLVQYNTIQMADAHLHNNDLSTAIPCLREFFGDECARKPFPTIKDTFNNGEYLGALCDSVPQDDLDKMIEQKTTENSEKTPIEECLIRADNPSLFQKYIDLGKNLGEPEQNSKPAGSESLQKTESENSNSGSLVLDFFKGTCNSKKEIIEFNQIEGEKEQQGTLACLAKCSSNFIDRLRDMLNDVKNEAIELIQSLITDENKKSLDSPKSKDAASKQQIAERLKAFDERIKNLQDMPKPSEAFSKEKFHLEFQKADKSKGIDLITEIGEKYLVLYAELYFVLSFYRTKETMQSNSALGKLDSNLGGIFSLYKNCAKLECGMASKSIPLYDLIETGARDPKFAIMKNVDSAKERFRNWVQQNPEGWESCKTLKDPTSLASSPVCQMVFGMVRKGLSSTPKGNGLVKTFDDILAKADSWVKENPQYLEAIEEWAKKHPHNWKNFCKAFMGSAGSNTSLSRSNSSN
ncbi:uncharacterized protein LOC135836920 [Planococcus citri]|uniref:uncharacterized protein LOC135836920 n=1 Tax=Planococcus citri TaxID=170843 RepID=UPI0031F8ED93